MFTLEQVKKYVLTFGKYDLKINRNGCINIYDEKNNIVFHDCLYNDEQCSPEDHTIYYIDENGNLVFDKKYLTIIDECMTTNPITEEECIHIKPTYDDIEEQRDDAAHLRTAREISRNIQNRKAKQNGFRYIVAPSDDSFEPLYTKTIAEVSDILKKYSNTTFNIKDMTL